MSPHVLALLLLSASPRPPSVMPGLTLAAEEEIPADLPVSLARARQRAEELRFEEAVVEYNRYLGVPNRPSHERAQALLELGFVHLVLGDEATARKRIAEALELEGSLKAAPGTPAKQVALLESVRQEVLTRPRLEVLPTDARNTSRVRARLIDPANKTSEVLLRHSLSPTGPFYATRMRCSADICEASIPPLAGETAYTAWYFLEANDARGNTLARSAAPTTPLQVPVIERTPWYESPWVYAGGAAVIIGAAAVFLATSTAPAH